MRRFALCAFAIFCAAGMVVADTEEVRVDGSVVANYVVVDNIDGDMTDTDGDSFGSIDMDISIGIEAELTDAVTTRVELATGALNGRADAVGTNTAGTELDVEEASITMEELLAESLTLKVGIFDVVLENRNDGNSLVLDTEEGVGVGTTVGGVALMYDADPASVTMAMLKMVESANANTQDTAAWLIAADYILDDTENVSRINGEIIVIDERGGMTGDPDVNGLWYVIGAGVDYFVYELELFAEVALQSGTLAEDAAAGESISAYAFDLGLEYTFDTDYEPFLGISYSYFSGDDDNADDDEKDYIMMGDLNKTLIIEDTEYGFGLTNNYQAIRLCGGLSPAEGSDLTLDISMFTLNETAGDDAIGTEVDVTYSQELTEDVTMTAAIGAFLPGEAMDGPDEDAEPAYLLSIGVGVDF